MAQKKRQRIFEEAQAATRLVQVRGSFILYVLQVYICSVREQKKLLIKTGFRPPLCKSEAP